MTEPRHFSAAEIERMRHEMLTTYAPVIPVWRRAHIEQDEDLGPVDHQPFPTYEDGDFA